MGIKVRIDGHGALAREDAHGHVRHVLRDGGRRRQAGGLDARDVDEVVRVPAALDDEVLLERGRAHAGEIGDDFALGQRGHRDLLLG